MVNDPLERAPELPTAELLNRVPFARLLGIELIEASRGTATMRLAIRDELRQIRGLMHGGVTASLIDTVTAFAIVSAVPEGEQFVTIDLTISYLRPISEGVVTATAQVLRAGRRVITVSAEMRDGAGQIAATALA